MATCHVSAPLDGGDIGMGDLQSGAGFSTTSVTREVVHFKSAAEILVADPKTKCKYEGVVMWCANEIRAIKPNSTAGSSPKRRRLDDEEVVALDMMLGDRTGPVYCTLWNEAAHAFLKGPAAISENRKIIRMDLAEIVPIAKNAWNGACLTEFRFLHSVKAVKNLAATNVEVLRTRT